MRKNPKKFSLPFIFTALLAAIIFFIINPLNTRLLNIIFLLLLVTIWGFSVYILRKKKVSLVAIFVIPIIALGILNLNGKQVSKEELRNGYIISLIKYDGTRYIWGGEGKIGIDCSGLVRRGMVDSYLKAGFKNLSPQYLRKALNLWYYDCSARGLMEGYKGFTVLILKDQTLNDLDYNLLKPGDIMVQSTGQHTMAYIGDKKWIQADPEFGKVFIKQVPDRNFFYFKTSVVIMRWRELC